MSFDPYLPKGQRTPEWYHQFADKFSDSLTMDRSEGAEVIRELTNHMANGILFLEAINGKLNVIENCIDQMTPKDLIVMGDSVIVPEPLEDDIWNNEFVGTTVEKRPDEDGVWLITVEDQEGNCFDVEESRLKLLTWKSLA